MNKKERLLYYLEYSVLFLFISSIALYFFYSSGKTMISEGGDGFRQHYNALLYYSNYLKKVLSGILKGSFNLPRWSFSIGEGADILLTLHLHAIGDIFAFFSFLCPEEYMYLYYDGITIARMYCSGLFFSSLCFYKKKEQRFSVLIGALLYAFCAFSITSMYNHVYFISAAVYLPLIVLGVEKIINDDKPYLLTIAVTLSALSNFYFFYMNVVSIVLYVTIRVLFLKDNWNKRIKLLARITLYSFLGVLISSVVFLPMLKTMLNNSRMNAPVQYNFFYTLSEYLSYYTKMTFNGTYFGGFSFLWLVGLSYVFVKKKNYTTTTLVIVTLLFVALPCLSSVYHGFAYPTDRWQYSVSLLFSYIIVETLDNLEDVNKLLPINIVFSVLYYATCIVLDYDNKMIHVFSLVLTFVFLCAVRIFNNRRIQSVITVVLILISLSVQMIYLFSPYYWGYPKNSLSVSDLPEKVTGERFVLNNITDEDFFRYSGFRLSENTNIHGDVSSTQHYWSIVNNNIVEFRKQLAYSDNSLHHFRNYGERFSQNALSGVKYYINDIDEDYIPYGFEYVATINDKKLYRSDYALPLVYSYSNYITEDEWSNFSPVQKNEALVQAAVIDTELNNIEKKPIKINHVRLPYEMSTSKNIEVYHNSINVLGDQAYINLNTKNLGSGEYYVVINGLYSNKLVAYINVEYDGIKKSFTFKGTDNQHYTDRHDYIVNLGYLDKINGTISLDFSDGGNYTYDSINVVFQPLDFQIECLKQLSELHINDLNIGIDKIDTTISLDEDKIICFSIPFSDGWRAYVDGTETELLRCNIQYMSLNVAKGSHTIELRYSTPMERIGTVLSCVGLLVFIVLSITNKVKNNE